MTGPRGARCTGAGEGPPVCTRRFQETRPGAESGVTAWREPRWSAERRARSGERAAAPEARLGGNIRCVARPHGTVAPFRRSASPYFFGGKSFVALVGKTRARVRRENEIARAFRPRYRGGGWSAPP